MLTPEPRSLRGNGLTDEGGRAIVEVLPELSKLDSLMCAPPARLNLVMSVVYGG